MAFSRNMEPYEMYEIHRVFNGFSGGGRHPGGVWEAFGGAWEAPGDPGAESTCPLEGNRELPGGLQTTKQDCK